MNWRRVAAGCLFLAALLCSTAKADDPADECPNDWEKTSPGICGCGIPDTDTDGDGTPDCIDACPRDPHKIAGGTCGCGVADVDSDGDHLVDCHDQCPLDPAKVVPGVCGCGVPDIDSDHDGVPDCHDGCPQNPLLTAPGPDGCPVLYPDLQVTINSDTESAELGQEVTFIVSVSNAGLVNATGMVVTVPIPSSATFSSARLLANSSGQSSPGEIDVADGAVTVHLGQIAPKQDVRIALVLTALTSGPLLLSGSAQSAELAAPVTGFNEVVLSIHDPLVQDPSRTLPAICGATGAVSLSALALFASAWSVLRRHRR